MPSDKMIIEEMLKVGCKTQGPTALEKKAVPKNTKTEGYSPRQAWTHFRLVTLEPKPGASNTGAIKTLLSTP